MESASGKKGGIEAVRMTMAEENIKMGNPEITETTTVTILNHNARFDVAVGPRVGEPGQYEGQYVLSIKYADSEVEQKGKAALGGWAQGIGSEYGAQANELARDFCERKGFTVANHVSSWPEFQAVVVKNNRHPSE